MFKKKIISVALLVLLLVLKAGVSVYSQPVTQKSTTQGKDSGASLRGGETRPTLPPSLFQGHIAKAYQIAKDIPHVLDSLYCYCYCDNPTFKHKSLLSCFVDDHASG